MLYFFYEKYENDRLYEKNELFIQAPESCPEWFLPVKWNLDFSQPWFCVARYEMAYKDLSDKPTIWIWNWIGDYHNSFNSYLLQTYPSCVLYFKEKYYPHDLEWEKIFCKASDFNNKNWWIVSKRWYPIWNLTQYESIEACKSMWDWYHLITSNEWMTIARDIELNPENWSWWIIWSNLYNWISANTDFWCNIRKNLEYSVSSYDDSCKKRIFKLSNWQVIWDFAWNLWEHVNKSNTFDWSLYNSGRTIINNPWFFRDFFNIPWLEWNSNSIIKSQREKYWPKTYTYSHFSNWIGEVKINYYNEGNDVFIRGWSSDEEDAWIYSLTLGSEYGFSSSIWFRCVKY
jgi:hypothetical protein